MAGSWTVQDIPDLTGKVVLVTGGNSGMGFLSTKLLLQKGATVVVASRSLPKVQQKVKELQAAVPGCNVSGHELDLASFTSIRAFAQAFTAQHSKLHVLVNNAGVFSPPFSRTEQGFEVTVGVNHFGAFYLTQLLLPALKAAAPSRVVFVSAAQADTAPNEIDMEDLTCNQATSSDMRQFAKSKQFSFMCAMDLDRRLKADGSRVDIFLANPGIVSSEGQSKISGLQARALGFLASKMGQSLESGVRPALYAVTCPDLQGKGGIAWGPTSDMRGGPIKRWLPKSAALQDEDLAQELFDATLQIVQTHAARLDEDDS